jgi:hypothetical protein
MEKHHQKQPVTVEYKNGLKLRCLIIKKRLKWAKTLSLAHKKTNRQKAWKPWITDYMSK